jgi:D-methionine transport system substrate-binding protein
VGLLPTSLDIINNPKKLKIVEIEAPQLPRAGRPADNHGDYQYHLLKPGRAVAVAQRPVCGKQRFPLREYFASRIENKDSEKVKNLVKAYQSDEVAAAAEQLYKGDAVKGW